MLHNLAAVPRVLAACRSMTLSSLKHWIETLNQLSLVSYFLAILICISWKKALLRFLPIWMQVKYRNALIWALPSWLKILDNLYKKKKKKKKREFLVMFRANILVRLANFLDGNGLKYKVFNKVVEASWQKTRYWNSPNRTCQDV